MKDIFKKLTDILMPIEEEEVVNEVKESVARQEQAEVVEKKVVNGESIVYAAPVRKAMPARPQLTVHTTKIPELKVLVYVPTDFDQVTAIADDLKAKRAAVVNYEHVDLGEQRRICDFINGVCYVLNGEARRISDSMVLYVPEGVSVAEVKPIAVEK